MEQPTAGPITQIPWDCDFIDTCKGRLFRAYARGATDPADVLLICNPLGEEAKSAFAVLDRFARKAWRAGWTVARLDYLGTGDSEGDFSQTRPTDWIGDARLVLAEMGRLFRIRRTILMGLRLGANIAARVADDSRKIVGLILWEPILDFGGYIRHMEWVSRDSRQNGVLDHFGWKIPRECLEALEGSLCLTPQHLRGAVFLAHVSGRKNLPADFERLRPLLARESKMVAVRSRPFWEMIGAAGCEELIQETMAWLGATGREGGKP